MIGTGRFSATAASPIRPRARLLSGLLVILLLTPSSLLAQRTSSQRVCTRGQGDRAHARRSSSTENAAQQDPDAERDSTTADPHDLTLYTSDGSGKLRFTSTNGDVRGRIGGRIMFDVTAGSVDDDIRPATGPMEDGTELRRSRLFTEGSLYDVGYKFQIEFAGEPDIKDMYLEFPSPVPNARITVGKFKEDISLVERTSSKYITFIARPMLTEFTGGRDLGVRFGGEADGGGLTYGVGVYRDKADDALGTSRGDGDYGTTGRVTYVPWRTDGGRRLIHLGAAGSLTSLDSTDPSREAHEPEVHLAPDFVDTGELTADRTTRLGVESALVYDAFSVQAEYLQRSYDLTVGESDPTFGSWYVSGSYFLTGEHRPHDDGDFDRVTPNENVREGNAGGLGAWQITARYSTMDLTDGGIVGGETTTLTAGVNWYLNPSVRIMLNYTHANVQNVVGKERTDGAGGFVSTRVQLDF